MHIIKLDLPFCLSVLIQILKQLQSHMFFNDQLISMGPWDKKSYYAARKLRYINSSYLLHYSRFNKVEQQMLPLCTEAQFNLTIPLNINVFLSFPAIIDSINASFNL